MSQLALRESQLRSRIDRGGACGRSGSDPGRFGIPSLRAALAGRPRAPGSHPAIPPADDRERSRDEGTEGRVRGRPVMRINPEAFARAAAATRGERGCSSTVPGASQGLGGRTAGDRAARRRRLTQPVRTPTRGVRPSIARDLGAGRTTGHLARTKSREAKPWPDAVEGEEEE
jgi:hypothetical protein